MKVSNVFLKKCFILTMCLSAFQAKADIISDNIGKLTSSVKGATTKDAIQKALCKKASLLSGKISLRSLEGKLCVGPLGAFALLACKGYSDGDGPFTDSACYKKAIDGVGGGDPDVGATTLLVNSLKGSASTTFKIAKPLVCTFGPIAFDLTGVGAPLGVALGAGCGAVDVIK